MLTDVLRLRCVCHGCVCVCVCVYNNIVHVLLSVYFALPFSLSFFVYHLLPLFFLLLFLTHHPPPSNPEHMPSVVSLLCESFNPHVRYGSCLALAIACAGTGSKVCVCVCVCVCALV